MATYKEIAKYILSLPEQVQNEVACFCNIDEDEMVFMSPEKVKIIDITLKDPSKKCEDMELKAIAVSDFQIDDTYTKWIY